jgi:hypothetical protein
MGMGSADGRRRAMRDGRREDDAETHGHPAADVWAREVAARCRPRLAELAPSRAHGPAAGDRQRHGDRMATTGS